MSNIEIYDCTLREGEQAAGASFSLDDRIELFKILDEFGVDYIEAGWPVAKEILESFKIFKKIRKKAKIVAFGSTSMIENPEDDKNLSCLVESNADYVCIFGKSHIEHVEKQLRINPKENLERISNSIKFLLKNDMKVFYDAEHYFDAFKSDRNYALETLIVAAKSGAERLILCDTNGGVLPDEAEEIIKETKHALLKRGIKTELGVHFHNDQGLALANTLISLKYIRQVQGTINGTGERIGNLNFSEFLPIYISKLDNKTNINLRTLKKINEEAYRLGGIDIPETRPFVGDTAFAHKGGVHIDAISKGASYEHANPENFGNKRVIILNTLGGKSAVIHAAQQFGYQLDKKDPKLAKKVEDLFEELKSLENKGYRIGTKIAEQYLLIEKYCGNLKDFFEIEKWKVETGINNGKEESKFFVKCKMNGNTTENNVVVEGGPVDAAYKTISEALSKKYPEIKKLQLIDFHVGIARRRKEESTVRTSITFQNRETFETVGVSSNIIESSLEAITKGFRYYLNKIYKQK